MNRDHQFFRFDERLTMIERSIGRPSLHNPLVMAEQIIQSRRMRDNLFPTGYFSDVAWEIILELYVAEQLGEANCTSSIGLASSLAPTSVLRHLARLEQDGFVYRSPDKFDARRTLVRISLHGIHTMNQLFSAMGTIRESENMAERPAIFKSSGHS